jgi:flagellar biosynthesis/type III secretory pathway M-ring protein FliF/YscJ
MAQPYPTPQQVPAAIPPRRVAQVIVLGGAGVGVVAVVVALALWFHYGTAVFFETIAAGISACF